MIARVGRWLARFLPVIIDLAAFVLIVVGVARLWGDWAWLAAGVLLVLAGLRAQD